MLKRLFPIVLFLSGVAYGQSAEERLVTRMKNFHQNLVGDGKLAVQFVDDSLSYGHSNGWIENRKEFAENLGTRLVYHSIKEDSISATIHKNTAYLRFKAAYDVSLGGNRATYHLKVLEVWVRHKKKSDWKLIARQAVTGQ